MVVITSSLNFTSLLSACIRLIIEGISAKNERMNVLISRARLVCAFMDASPTEILRAYDDCLPFRQMNRSECETRDPIPMRSHERCIFRNFQICKPAIDGSQAFKQGVNCIRIRTVAAIYWEMLHHSIIHYHYCIDVPIGPSCVIDQVRRFASHPILPVGVCPRGASKENSAMFQSPCYREPAVNTRWKRHQSHPPDLR